MVALDGPDLTATEVSYHRSCYHKYINLKIPKEGKNQSDETDSIQIYDDTFEELRKEIEIRLFESLEVLKMSILKVKMWSFSPVEEFIILTIAVKS